MCLAGHASESQIACMQDFPIAAVHVAMLNSSVIRLRRDRQTHKKTSMSHPIVNAGLCGPSLRGSSISSAHSSIATILCRGSDRAATTQKIVDQAPASSVTALKRPVSS